MRTLKMTLAHTTVAIMLVVSPLLAWTGVLETLAEADQQAGVRSQTYRDAQRALDEKDWATAESLFSEVAEANEADADAALYWQAFAQLKRGRSAPAVRTLQQLERRYPESAWIDDAKVLAAEARAGGGGPVELKDAEDEELKLYAINSLMHVQSERAVPILDRFLAGDHSLELKEKALFVLSQSASPQARDLLVAIARGERQPELSMEAIEYLGLAGGAETAALLQQIYDSTSDREVKQQALEAMMLGGYEANVLAAARTEQDPEARSAAVEMLGIMGAEDELRDLYSSESSAEVKAGILEALFLAGDVETLQRIATSEPSPDLRATAIEGLALVGSAQAGAALQSLWSTETDREIKSALLEAFFLQGDAETLIQVVRDETDRELRQEALEYLSMVGSEEAVDFLLELIEE